MSQVLNDSEIAQVVAAINILHNIRKLLNNTLFQLTEQQSSYRQIFKATSIFGGVQVIQIAIGIVRTKFVAVLLGTAGVGIMGFKLSYTADYINNGLGIAFGAVRDVSEAYGSNDHQGLQKQLQYFVDGLGLQDY
jgi:Na+-driven multidrug efflux pump